MEFQVESPSTVTGVLCEFGFGEAAAGPGQSLFFFNDGISPNIYANTRGAGAPSGAGSIDTGVVFASGTIYLCRIEMYDSTAPGGERTLYYLDGVLVAQNTVAGDQMLPNASGGNAGMRFSVTENGAGAPRGMTVGPISCWAYRDN